MRFKPVPTPPESIDRLAAAQEAVGLVPDPEADCCARIGTRIEVPREDARSWLTFLRALGLVRHTDRGFVRTDRESDGEATVSAFRERVFGAREVLDALPGGTTVDEAFEAVAASVPAWERERREDWRAFYRERTRRLLGWAALLGLAERDGKVFSPGETYPDP